MDFLGTGRLGWRRRRPSRGWCWGRASSRRGWRKPCLLRWLGLRLSRPELSWFLRFRLGLRRCRIDAWFAERRRPGCRCSIAMRNLARERRCQAAQTFRVRRRRLGRCLRLRRWKAVARRRGIGNIGQVAAIGHGRQLIEGPQLVAQVSELLSCRFLGGSRQTFKLLFEAFLFLLQKRYVQS